MLENAAADILAERGYRVHQRPDPEGIITARTETGDVGRPERRPDYLVEGRVFDCYAPTSGKPVRGIWSEAAGKVEEGQTQRVVINLQDWAGELAALRQQFADWPIDGLKEVKVITADRRVVQLRLSKKG